MSDLCYHCEGTGERDFLSGARCYECNGTGWIEEPEYDDNRCIWCDGTGAKEIASDGELIGTCDHCKGHGVELPAKNR